MSKKRSSGLDFADRWPSSTTNTFEQHPDNQDNGSVHLQRNLTEGKRNMQGLQRTLTIGSSGLDFPDHNTINTFEQHPDLVNNQDKGSSHLQRNFTERRRMQGLQRSLTIGSSNVVPRTQRTFKEKCNIWLINKGSRHIFFASWVFLHLLVAIFGYFLYALSDNLEDARSTFGITYRASFIYLIFQWYWYLILSLPSAIARSAALVLYVDVAFILLPVCRNFISFLRRTPLNDFIPFDKALTFHKITAWAIVAFTVIHIIAHMVNFYRFAMANESTTTARLRVFLSLNFTTGPGITGWIMTTCLAAIVFFSRDKIRKVHFERFWYAHHLFILLFINWQLHGMFCMIKPDRPPFCSYNSVGVFWVSFFPLLSFSLLFSFWIQQTAVLASRRIYLDRWTYSSRSSVPSYHLHLQSDPASLECHGTTDQERKDYHQSWSICLPVLSWSLLFPMAPFHVDQVYLVDVIITLILCSCSFT